jgi:acetaldehyde dehydrogenase (acetylating)
MKKARIAIIGTGNIGGDICARLSRDEDFEIVAFVGRRSDSPGLKKFGGLAKNSISGGINQLLPFLDSVDGIFDATSAFDHQEHWKIARHYQKWMIDLTPSDIGQAMVPALIGKSREFTLSKSNVANYSMATCGGQSSAPIVFAMTKFSKGIQEVEVSSSIASKSAGPATRKNIDHYISATENLVHKITGCMDVKAILVLNPIDPPTMMRTTVQMKVSQSNIGEINKELSKLVFEIKLSVPGYDVVVEPHFSSDNVISATAKVTGAGYFLPSYSGNLDIINAAAVETARQHHRLSNGAVRA